MRSAAAFARQDFTSDDGVGGHHSSVPLAPFLLQKQAESKVWQGRYTDICLLGNYLKLQINNNK